MSEAYGHLALTWAHNLPLFFWNYYIIRAPFFGKKVWKEGLLTRAGYLPNAVMPAITIELSFQFLLPRAGITPCTEFYEILNSAHQSTLTYLRDWSTALAAAAVHPHYQVHSMPYSGCQNYVFSCFPFLNHTTMTMIWGMLVYITNIQSSQIRLEPACHRF